MALLLTEQALEQLRRSRRRSARETSRRGVQHAPLDHSGVCGDRLAGLKLTQNIRQRVTTGDERGCDFGGGLLTGGCLRAAKQVQAGSERGVFGGECNSRHIARREAALWRSEI